MILYQTDNMEAATLAMCERNRNALVHFSYKCVKPIRLQFKLIPLGVLGHDVSMWRPHPESTIERWQRDGGGLIYRPHPNTKTAVPPACDAQLFIEAPMEYRDLERLSTNVRQETIVYRPPTWELHNLTADHMWPPVESHQMLDALCKGFYGREVPDDMAACLKLSGFAHGAVFTAWEVEQFTGWSEKYLRYLLRPYRWHSHRWHIYSTRIAPVDPDMRWAYDILRGQPPVEYNTYPMRFNMLREGKIAGFKRMFKRLEKENYVVREDCIYTMNVQPNRPLDIDRMAAVNNMHRGRFFKMKSAVDAAPEYPL